jgi:TolB protein
MKKNYLLALATSVILVSCGGSKFAVTTGGENLTALTKVTDGEESSIHPFGGDNGANLFYAVGEKKGKYYNIFKKDNPFATASVQKTSGNNINYAPAYCAATDKIAFRCQNDGMNSSDIFMMSGTQGKALTQITESHGDYEGNPCFSNDGGLLVYDKQSYEYYKKANWASLLFGGYTTVIVENSEIWLKNLKTGESTLLGNGYQPSFSPDGKQIAYVKYSSDAKSTSIYLMNLDGTNQIQVTDAKKGYALNPRWSPDGKKIIFQLSKKDKKDFDIYVVNIDGENLTQLTLNKSSDATPYWTTDGYIYFASDRGGKKGKFQIWRFKYAN